MAKLGSVTFVGDSGKKYDFIVYSLDTGFDAVGAVYFFTERTEKSDGGFVHSSYVYVGQTGDLSERFDNHHAMPCIEKNGANCICIHKESSKDKRCEIEQDLIDNYNTLCNK